MRNLTFTRFKSSLLLLLLSGCAGEPPAVSVLDRLQGHWEGEGPPGKYTITIEGHALHYEKKADDWFDTTFTLHEGTDPQQLHATILASGQPTSGIGDVVYAIMKIEHGTLTLAVDDGSEEPPKSFDEASSRYVLRKIQGAGAIRKDP